MILEFSCTIYENFRLRRAYNLVFWQLCMMKIDTNIMDWSYQTWKIWQILFDWDIWLPAIPVVSIGFYFVPFGFHLWGLIWFEIITILFEKLLYFHKKVSTKKIKTNWNSRYASLLKLCRVGKYTKKACFTNVIPLPKTLPYFYTIQFLKLYKNEKVLDIKSQSVHLKINLKPWGAWACLSC